MAPPEQPVFFYDLGSPECYLVAERVMGELEVVPEWEPVLARRLPLTEPALDREDFARRAREQALQPLRWPDPFPPDAELAALTATYAKRGGRAVAFSLAAFRQAFAGGRDLGDQDTVLIAAAACELHPAAVLKAIALRSTRERLQAATERARRAAVSELPAISVGGEVFSGPDCIERAGAALAPILPSAR